MLFKWQLTSLCQYAIISFRQHSKWVNIWCNQASCFSFLVLFRTTQHIVKLQGVGWRSTVSSLLHAAAFGYRPPIDQKKWHHQGIKNTVIQSPRSGHISTWNSNYWTWGQSNQHKLATARTISQQNTDRKKPRSSSNRETEWQKNSKLIKDIQAHRI